MPRANKNAPIISSTMRPQFRAVIARADFDDFNESLGLLPNVPDEPP